jgi:acyl-CoA oxidase
MGFLSCNKIGPMANDMNVDVTFEGDNTVLMQQVRRRPRRGAGTHGGARSSSF